MAHHESDARIAYPGDDQVAAWRSLFPVTTHGTYLFNGGFSVCPTPVQEAIVRALR